MYRLELPHSYWNPLPCLQLPLFPLLLPLTLLYICVAHTSSPRTCIYQQNYLIQTWRLKSSSWIKYSCAFSPRVVSASASYNSFWPTRILRAFATYTVAATSLRPPPASVSADDLDKAVVANTLLVCLCCDKDNASKRLEHLLFRNHSHMTPTRRVLYLELDLYPRAPPAQHPQRPRPRLR